MTPAYIKSLLDDGQRCWMTIAEAASYTGASPADVVQAVLRGDLVGESPPGGGALDRLIARHDVEQWMDRRMLGEPSA
jgi:excisionase family DNA binding protein